MILPVVSCECETWLFALRYVRKLRVTENRLLRRIFVPKREKVTGEWRKLHSEEHNYLYSSPNSFRVMKSRRIRWAGRVGSVGRGEVHTGFWWRNPRESDHLEYPGIDWRTILRWI
jgi:hypothetical protein